MSDTGRKGAGRAGTAVRAVLILVAAAVAIGWGLWDVLPDLAAHGSTMRIGLGLTVAAFGLAAAFTCGVLVTLSLVRPDHVQPAQPS